MYDITTIQMNQDTRSVMEMHNDGLKITITCHAHDRSIEVDTLEAANTRFTNPESWCTPCFIIKTQGSN